jgi:hypothetical protein
VGLSANETMDMNPGVVADLITLHEKQHEKAKGG